MYRQTPKFGYCPGPDQTVLRALKEDDFIDIEMVLRFFHQEVKSYLDTLSAFHRVQFLGNVDSAVVDALFSTKKSSLRTERQERIKDCLKPILRRLKASWKQWNELQLPEFCRIGNEVAEATPAVAAPVKVEPLLLPKVIPFTPDGVPLDAQEEVEVAISTDISVLPWQPFFALDAVRDKMHRDMAKAAVVAASTSLMMHNLSLLGACPFKLMRVGGKLKVISEKVLPVGALQIPWYAPDVRYLVDKSEHPFAVDVKHSVIETDGKMVDLSWRANPHWSIPSKAASTSSSVEDAVWIEKHCVNWFWGFRRLPDEELWNCEVATFVINIVHVARFNQVSALADGTPQSVTAEVLLPMITNTREIKQDEEIVVKVSPLPEKEKTKRIKNWITDVKANQLRPK